MNQEILFAEAAFGRDVQDFMESEIGRLIVGRAEQEAAIAIELLKKASPNDSVEITRLQNQIFVAESIKGWLAQAVSDGLQAERVLTEESYE